MAVMMMTEIAQEGGEFGKEQCQHNTQASPQEDAFALRKVIGYGKTDNERTHHDGG